MRNDGRPEPGCISLMAVPSFGGRGAYNRGPYRYFATVDYLFLQNADFALSHRDGEKAWVFMPRKCILGSFNAKDNPVTGFLREMFPWTSVRNDYVVDIGERGLVILEHWISENRFDEGKARSLGR